MDLQGELYEILTGLLVLFTAVPVHECAHALAADRLGDPTPRNQGRLTLNPFAHLTVWGSLMMIFAHFGWGRPVEINIRNFKHPKLDAALTALAGPAANFIMAYVGMVAYRLCYMNTESNDMFIYLAIVLGNIIVMNIYLAVFNLIPVPPLDGSRIFNAVMPDKIYYKIMQYEKYIVIVVIILMYSGLLSGPMGFIKNKILGLMFILTGWVDLLIK